MKNLILVSVSLLLFLGFAVKTSAQSCPTTFADVPAPIDIDGVTMVSSHFYLHIPFGACELPFDQIEPKTSEDSARVTAQALMDGNFKGYQQTFSRQADTNESFIKELFDRQSAVFQKDHPDRISQKYKLGILDYFVLGNSVGRLGDELEVIKMPGKNFYNGRSYTLNPLVENLDAAVRALPVDFKTFPDRPEGNYYQAADVLPYDNGSVTCFFKGQMMDLDILQKPVAAYTGPYADLMAFYQSSYQHLVNRQLEAYLADFSPASRKVEESMIAQKTFETFAWTNTGTTHTVGFILDADPVYFIFWHIADGDDFIYDTVLKTQEGTFQRVNVQHDTTLDHLLRDRTFADNLQDIIADQN
jgi:hypothetical protein